MENAHSSKRKNIEHYKALVVEDVPIIQEMHQRYLEALGYQVYVGPWGVTEREVNLSLFSWDA